MERVLKPERFDTEPGKATSEQAWRHWKKTFDYFTNSFTGANQLDDTKKLAALTNCVSPYVFTFISAADKFTDAINILEGIYVRPRNEVYARHLVSSRKQQDHESVDEFMNALDLLAKDCSFADVTKDVHRDEFVRDAIVRGLKSPEIKQRGSLRSEKSEKTVLTRLVLSNCLFKTALLCRTNRISPNAYLQRVALMIQFVIKLRTLFVLLLVPMAIAQNQPAPIVISVVTVITQRVLVLLKILLVICAVKVDIKQKSAKND